MTLRPDRTLRVTAVGTPAPGVRSITFAADDGRPLPSFPPGSHVGVEWAPSRLNVYSLTGPGREPDRWHVSVALRPDGSGGSARMHRLAVGDRVAATAPRSAFAPVGTAAHHVLVAGGIGVTPILSHARWHAFWGNSFEVFAARAPHTGDLRALGPLHVFDDRSGLLAAVRARLAAAPFNAHVYTCGPPGMIDAVAAAARDAHWVDARVHAERFVPDAGPGRPFRAVLRAGGRTIDVGADETLLDALERAGVPAPSLCRQGVCGECVTTVHSGRVEHRDTVLSPAERDGRMAVCVSRAAGTTLEIDR